MGCSAPDESCFNGFVQAGVRPLYVVAGYGTPDMCIVALPRIMYTAVELLAVQWGCSICHLRSASNDVSRHRWWRA
jgi:hypothetical protein